MLTQIHCLILMLLYNFVNAQTKSSLTFVIDDTYSMTDDIDAVRHSVNAIFDTVMNSNTSQIEDFVLVTFNDPYNARLPKTIHRITTRDREAFKRALDDIYVKGGHDCPEMSMHGIKHALEESRIGSLVYVFTDASSKDPELYDEVQRLAQKKQCEVVFVLTGTTCKDDEVKGNHIVYNQLAKQTNGQAFHLGKDEVKKILKFVETQIIIRPTTLIRKEFPAGRNSFDVTVDSKMKELTISISGTEPEITVTGPSGEVKEIEDMVRTTDVTIVRVKEVTPGKYRAEVKCSTEITVKVSAATTVHFQHGFSTFVPASIDVTTFQPIPDKESYLSIKLNTIGEGDVKLDTVQILDLDNNLVTEQRLRLLDEKTKLYVSSKPVVPPNTTFRIAIKGYDAENNEIIRISLTPIEPQIRETRTFRTALAVKLVGESKRTAEFRRPLELQCSVRGNPRPEVIWQNGAGTRLKSELHLIELPSDYVSVLKIYQVLRNDTYKCTASNDHGTDSKIVTVETFINEYFNVVKKPRSADILYGQKAKFECIIDANPPAKIRWFKHGHILTETDNIMTSPDGSVLTFEKMHPNEAGKYQCEARNVNIRQRYGFVVHIVGVELPVIDKNTTEVFVKERSDATILCRIIKGKPKPTINWYFKHDSGEYEAVVHDSVDKEELHIDEVTDAFAGTYRCEAQNEIGFDYHNTELFAGSPPVFDKVAENVMGKEGESTQLPCDVNGRPTPTIKWFFNGTELSIHKRFVRKAHSGTIIFKPTLSDVGTYVCEAKNKYGAVNKTIHLNIVIPPKIEIPEVSTFEKRAGDHLSLPCRADGYPKPTVAWSFHSLDKKNMPRKLRALSDGTMAIARIQLHQQGYYTCVSTNVGGSTNITYTVLVHTPPSIVTEVPEKPYIGVEGDLVLQVPCKASGTPAPEISWYKNGFGLPSGTDWYDTNVDGTLVIKRLDMISAGKYTCQAKNAFGVAKKTVDVIVQAFPPPGLPSSTVAVKEGNSATIKCNVPHWKTEAPRWFKDGKLLATNESYELKNVTISDSGIYTCRGSDFAKSESGHVEVIVGSKPRFVYADDSVETNILFEMDRTSEEMNCEATGVPDPKVTWWHNGKEINVTTMAYNFTMTLKDRGHYVCSVENEYGRITREFNVTSQDCLLNLWSEIKERQPLLLSQYKTSWPQFRINEDYIVMASGEYVKLICPSGFSNFPHKNDINVQCDQESSLKYEDNIYKISDFQCKRETELKENVTREECMPSEPEAIIVKMGFRTPKDFIEVYDVCLDVKTRIPFYAKHRLQYSLSNSEPERRSRHDMPFVSYDANLYNCKQNRYSGSKLAKWFNREDSCCFKERQLVNSKDVFPGLAQMATYSNINVLPHWSTCNSKNWDDVEDAVRGLVKTTRAELLVYTGTAPRRTDTPVAPFIWKVVIDTSTKKSVAIVQVNVPDVSSKDLPGLLRCHDICHEISWLNSTRFHDISQGYTYCCKTIAFEKAFGFKGVFERGEGYVLRDLTLVPETSLT